MWTCAGPIDRGRWAVLRRAPLLILAAALAAACSDDDAPSPGVDGGLVSDAGGADLGPRGDSGALADGGSDAGARDSGLEDAGAADAATSGDAGVGGCGFTTVEDARYAAVSALSDAALVARLHTLVSSGAQGYGYDAARNLMYGITGSVDVDAQGLVTCAYTGIQIAADGSRSPDDGTHTITTEHSWPRSDGAESFPAEGDLHHLFPAISESNGRRGIFEFGNVACGDGGEPSCAWSEGGSRLGPGEDGRATTFEVRSGTRGDIARAHFYFAVRYQLSIPPEEEAALRAWHCEDPPSGEERARNARIEGYQNNRNPFVDQPQLADRITDF